MQRAEVIKRTDSEPIAVLNISCNDPDRKPESIILQATW